MRSPFLSFLKMPIGVCYCYLSKSIDQQRKIEISAFPLKSCLFWWLEWFYHLITSSKLTNKILYWPLDLPTYLINGSSSIFVNTFNWRKWLILSNIFGSLFSLTNFLYISFFSRINTFNKLSINKFHIFVNPRKIPIIKCNGFMWNMFVHLYRLCLDLWMDFLKPKDRLLF